MTQPLMRRCPQCGEYTLSATCPRDGARTADPRPARFSPEDPYGEYRRKAKRAQRKSAPSAQSAPAQPPGPR